MGRPSDFSPEIANAICERLIEGESLRRICRDDEMPSASTVCRWLGQFDEFREQYAHARDAQADTLADEILDIVDDNTADPQRARLQMDARKWLSGKMAPKRYGDAVQMKHTGEEGGPVETVMRWALQSSEATEDPSAKS